MAFKFNVEKPSVKVMDRLELLQAQEELNQAFMDLTDAQKGMTEVCEVMENIQTSVVLITKYGAAGVEQLNVDGSLEALLQVPAKLITAEKAQEGLSDAAKTAWEKLKGWAKLIWEKLIKVFNWVMEKLGLDSASQLREKLKGVTDEQIAEAAKNTPVDVASTESKADYFGYDPKMLSVDQCAVLKSFITDIRSEIINCFDDFKRVALQGKNLDMIKNYIREAKASASSGEIDNYISELEAEFKEQSNAMQDLISNVRTKLAEARPTAATNYMDLGWKASSIISGYLDDQAVEKSAIHNWIKTYEDVAKPAAMFIGSELEKFTDPDQKVMKVVRLQGQLITRLTVPMFSLTTWLIRIFERQNALLINLLGRVPAKP